MTADNGPSSDDRMTNGSNAFRVELLDILTPGRPGGLAILTDDEQWAELAEVAGRSKLSGLLHAFMKSAGIEGPLPVMQHLRDWRTATLQVNLANLDRTIRVAAVLANVGIAAIVIKGAIRAHAVYGSWDIRPSQDIDLLVHPADYQPARVAMVAAGFQPIAEADSSWWHDHLGECAFLGTDGTGPVIDLHQQVHQPGIAAPSDLKGFFAASEQVRFRNTDVQVLSPAHAMLLCAINFAKAKRAETPWVSYAHELLTCWDAAPADLRREVELLARSNGIWRMWQGCLSLSQQVFAIPARPAPLSSADEALVESAFGVGEHHFLERSILLWKWIDGAPVTRAVRFVREWLDVLRSERAFRAQGH